MAIGTVMLEVLQLVANWIFGIRPEELIILVLWPVASVAGTVLIAGFTSHATPRRIYPVAAAGGVLLFFAARSMFNDGRGWGHIRPLVIRYVTQKSVSRLRRIRCVQA